MSDWEHPGPGTGDDPEPAPEQVAAPVDPHAADAGGAASPDPPVDDEVVRVRDRARPETVVLLLAGILVVVAVQLALGWFTFSTTNQLRDQYTLANGLQRCLIDAQLNHNPPGDTAGSAYKNAVQGCLAK